MTTLAALALASMLLWPAAAGAAPAHWDAPGWGYSVTGGGVEYTSHHGTFVVTGAIDVVHRSSGGGTGSLGYPTSSQVPQTVLHSYQSFERGVIYSSPSGTFAVQGAIHQRHRSDGGGSGSLGYPTGHAVREGAQYWFQTFERGVLYSGPQGTYPTIASSAIAGMHRDTGGGRGANGYPIGDEMQFLDGQWLQPFERGYAFVETNQGLIPAACSASCYAIPGNGSYWLPRAWESSEIVRLTNVERAREGLGALREDPVKSALATRWSGKMAATDHLWHNPQFSASGNVSSENVLYTGVARAAAYDATATAKSAVALWMGSAGHRANILRSGPDEIGVGWIVRSSPRLGAGGYRTDIAWATQVFGR